MPESTTEVVKTVWEVIRYPMVVVLGMFGWAINRQVKRVDKIESQYASKDTFNATLAALRSEIKEGFSELKTDMRHINSRIDSINGGDK